MSHKVMLYAIWFKLSYARPWPPVLPALLRNRVLRVAQQTLQRELAIDFGSLDFHSFCTSVSERSVESPAICSM